MKKGIDTCEDMEKDRAILFQEFLDLGYKDLAEFSLTIDKYENLTEMAYILHKLAKINGRIDISESLIFDGWIYT